ncbi:MAG: hemerythrin domain-containing protein [Acidobacteriota bacterium]|nr:hemerythrin domain-containing protein [Acidobacteriota bacterium]
MARDETKPDPLDVLVSARTGLRSRFDDFRRALERRDEEAYRVALRDFHRELLRWTDAEERVLLPAIGRVGIPGRDPNRELKLEYVQLRELTRYVLEQISQNGRLADVLGLVDNLERRLSAHESEMEKVYYPAVAAALTIEELRALEGARPPD